MGLSDRAFSKMATLEKRMSFHDPQSELSYLNREAANRCCEISDDMAAVLGSAMLLSRLTAGRYDLSIAPELVKNGLLPQIHTVIAGRGSWQDICLEKNKLHFKRPLLLDLGGIAKGYAVDQAFLSIQDEVDDVVINAGGDLRMKCWQGKTVAIKTHHQAANSTVDVLMKSAAVATTAAYYFGPGHSAIIDPETREMLLSEQSVSVYAQSCVIADALTKVVLLADNVKQILQSMCASAVIVGDDGAIRSL